jgi:hypothetical protein
MLADEIGTDVILPRAVIGAEPIQKKIMAAQKFCLAPEFTLAADGLVENIPQLTRIAPFCRIPYPLCWFEFAHLDRVHWRDAPTHFPNEQYTPSRIGYLAEALDDKLNRWRTYLCWSLKNFTLARHNISELAVIYDISKLGSDLVDTISFEYVEIIRPGAGLVSAEHMSKLIQSDWAGEIRCMFAILGLLNARNVVETEKVDYHKLNRHRVAKGKPSLSSHTLLKIRAVHKRSLIGRSGGAGSAEIRAHFVRGHFKTRRTGAFWWGPHMRGKLERGYVSKDYEIKD